MQDIDYITCERLADTVVYLYEDMTIPLSPLLGGTTLERGMVLVILGIGAKNKASEKQKGGRKTCKSFYRHNQWYL
ncbi:MAG: hypothetical protein ACYC6Q_00935 [Syntrophales bacterium]